MKKNKKGFTLIEVLTVISLIAIISLLISRPVVDLLKKMDYKACESQNENMIEAAKLWFSENKINILIEIGSTHTITVQNLIDDGFVEEKIKNVLTKEDIDKTTEIIITRETADYYKFELAKKICQ